MSEDATKRVTKVLSFLAALYPRFELTTATIKAYTQILEDIPEDLLQAAAKDIGSRSTFFPAASEIRQAAFDLREQALGLPSAYEAWAEVRDACQRYGARNKPDFSHEIVERAVVGVGGYQHLCYSTDHTADRARFIDCYEDLARRWQRQERTLPVIGAFVQQQLAAGNDRADAMTEQIERVTARLSAANRRVNHE